MPYEVIQPPFTLKFEEMPKKELRSYFQWYLNSIPDRIKVLTAAVQQTPAFEEWTADYSPESLNRLGEWLADQVEKRERTQAEIEEEIRKVGTSFPRPQDVVGTHILTIRSLSIAMDVGMYLSQVFQTNHPSLRWDQPFGSKRFIDYGQPVLVGFGPRGMFNPTHIIIVLASALADHLRTKSRLREIYDIWAKKVGD